MNGPEMCELYKFLKRNTRDFFIPRYGMATHIYDYHEKFLCNRYGALEKHYPPSAEYAIIERDIAELLKVMYNEEKFKRMVEPPDLF